MYELNTNMTTEIKKLLPIDPESAIYTKRFVPMTGQVYALGIDTGENEKFKGKVFTHGRNADNLQQALSFIGSDILLHKSEIPVPGVGINVDRTIGLSVVQYDYQSVGLWYEVKDEEIKRFMKGNIN